jgi:hypothetical protein
MNQYEAQEPEFYIAPKRICTNRAWSAIVPEDHPDAAFQVAAAGGQVPIDLARRLGLLDHDPVALEERYRIQEIANRRSETVFNTITRVIYEQAILISDARGETQREFKVHAPNSMFQGVLRDILDRNRDYELPDGKGTISAALWNKESVSGTFATQLDLEVTVVLVAPDGSKSLWRQTDAVHILVVPVRRDVCRVVMYCNSGYAAPYYFGALLPLLGKDYPESRLADSITRGSEHSANVPFRRQPHMYETERSVLYKKAFERIQSLPGYDNVTDRLEIKRLPGYKEVLDTYLEELAKIEGVTFRQYQAGPDRKLAKDAFDKAIERVWQRAQLYAL